MCYGYSPEISNEFRDVWPLVFNSLAHENNNFVYDCFSPNVVHTKLRDEKTIKRQIIERLKIALSVGEAKYTDEDLDPQSDESNLE